MSKQFDPKNKSNFIEKPEDLAKELFGYDDETLLRELKEAELELEQMKADHPELEEQIRQETEAGFEALMQKIHDEDIKPVTEWEYSEKKKEEERKVTRLRPILKGVFVAAAILAVLSGMGGVVSARKGFEYQKVKTGKSRNEVEWISGDQLQISGDLDKAYEKIKAEIGITVLKLNYIPTGMKFDELVIEKGHATMEFSYNGRKIHFKQIKCTADNVVEKVVSDRNEEKPVYNSFLNMILYIEENVLEDSLKEYCVEIDLGDAHYYVSGMINENEFENIVKEIYVYQD